MENCTFRHNVATNNGVAIRMTGFSRLNVTWVPLQHVPHAALPYHKGTTISS